MRIAVLEWILGGGLLDQPLAQIPPSLLDEGRQMLDCACQQFLDTGCEVSIALDARLADSLTCASPRLTRHVIQNPLEQTSSRLLENWIAIAHAADRCLVIAPEIENQLARVLNTLRDAGIQTLNCRPPFLDNASDKWATWLQLERARVPTPPTIQLHALNADWLAKHAAASYILKPRFGAGCFQTRCIPADLLAARNPGDNLTSTLGDAEYADQYRSATDWIVQPWLEGEHYSCSALINDAGERSWLPLCHQAIERQSQDNGHQTVHYLGGSVADQHAVLAAPTELLDRAVDACGQGAKGWVNIDLLHFPKPFAASPWSIVEINPRLSSSVCALVAAQQENLLGKLLPAESTIAPLGTA